MLAIPKRPLLASRRSVRGPCRPPRFRSTPNGEASSGGLSSDELGRENDRRRRLFGMKEHLRDPVGRGLADRDRVPAHGGERGCHLRGEVVVVEAGHGDVGRHFKLCFLDPRPASTGRKNGCTVCVRSGMLETTPIRSGSPFGARSVSQLDDRSSLAPPSRSSMVQTASAVRGLSFVRGGAELMGDPSALVTTGISPQRLRFQSPKRVTAASALIASSRPYSFAHAWPAGAPPERSLMKTGLRTVGAGSLHGIDRLGPLLCLAQIALGIGSCSFRVTGTASPAKHVRPIAGDQCRFLPEPASRREVEDVRECLVGNLIVGLSGCRKRLGVERRCDLGGVLGHDVEGFLGDFPGVPIAMLAGREKRLETQERALVARVGVGRQKSSRGSDVLRDARRCSTPEKNLCVDEVRACEPDRVLAAPEQRDRLAHMPKRKPAFVLHRGDARE